MDAEQIIRELQLSPHPEGGYFRETFRDPSSVQGRSYSTAIYFLLTGDQRSRWHRIDAAEIFHFYAGAPLLLSTLDETAPGPVEVSRVLGPDLAAGHQPQLIIEPGQWQSARSLGAFSLVGCTVSPGFEFRHFEMRPE